MSVDKLIVFFFVWVVTYRDISFLCDAVVSHKKPAALPPLTDRNGTGSREVSPSQIHDINPPPCHL